MNDTLIIFLVFLISAAVAAVAIYVKKHTGRNNPAAVKKAEENTTLGVCRTMTKIGATPGGISIYGKVLPSLDILTAFDAGLSKSFKVARECLGYDKNLELRNWSIFLMDSFLSPEQHIPSYFYPNPKGAADGQMMVAGEYLVSKNPAEQSWIAVAEPLGNVSFAFEVMNNEGEHGADAHNSADNFHANGQPGHIHPVHADCTAQLRGLFSKTAVPLKCGFTR